jgi:transcriptional regulator NrdR family protein
MRCPQCGERETRVVDSRDLDDSATIRRRRECASCTMRFTTYERVEAARLVVVKRDGTILAAVGGVSPEANVARALELVRTLSPAR